MFLASEVFKRYFDKSYRNSENKLMNCFALKRNLVFSKVKSLTLTRPIGLPPSHARGAQNCGSARFLYKNDVIKGWLV